MQREKEREIEFLNTLISKHKSLRIGLRFLGAYWDVFVFINMHFVNLLVIFIHEQNGSNIALD